jgi:acetyl-CoA C-acetyltransferase
MSDLAYISGIGRTRFGVLQEQLPELTYKAIYNALEDANLSPDDIDAIYIANFLAGAVQNQLHLNSLIASLLPGFNKPIIRIETACASGAAAVFQAVLSLSRFERVLVVGVEKMTTLPGRDMARALAMAGDWIQDYGEGLIFPASYALVAQNYMNDYGATHDDLLKVSYKNHKNANLNADAHFNYKKVGMDEINASPIICSPFNIFDCCPISDGAAAVVISKDRIKDSDPAIVGSAIGTDAISLTQRASLTSFAATKEAAACAYAQAGLGPKDIDIAEVHDCFTIAEMVALEDLGFCPPGGSVELVRSGATELDGKLPVNTDGGLIGDGHPIGATGLAQLFELVTQLRGTAGKRQIKNAKTGLALNVGGVGGTGVVHILRGA